MVSSGGVLRAFLFLSLVCCGRAPKPRTHEVDQSPGRLLSFNPHAPPLEGGGGVGNAVLPLFGRVPTISGELLAGEFECEPVLQSLGVG
jgi:hypothetical protein